MISEKRIQENVNSRKKIRLYVDSENMFEKMYPRSIRNVPWFWNWSPWSSQFGMKDAVGGATVIIIPKCWLCISANVFLMTSYICWRSLEFSSINPFICFWWFSIMRIICFSQAEANDFKMLSQLLWSVFDELALRFSLEKSNSLKLRVPLNCGIFRWFPFKTSRLSGKYFVPSSESKFNLKIAVFASFNEDQQISLK